jgi:DNA excision repair protein ERCC-2
MRAVEEAVRDGRSLAVNAPSGFGKTVSVLAGALSACRRVVWFVRTHRQAERVVEEARFMESKGVQVKAMAIQSRSSLCPHSTGLSPEEAVVVCRERRASCQLYRGFLTSYTPPPSLTLKPSELYAYCIERGLCPYYVQLSLVDAVRVVAASFHFLLIPSIRGVLRIDDDTAVVFDEAHGLPDALSTGYSLEVTQRDLDQALEEARGLGLKGGVVEAIEGLKDYLGRAEEGAWRPKELLRLLQGGTEYPLQVLAESMTYWGDEVRGEKARRGERPRSNLHLLGRFLFKLLTCGDGYTVVTQPGSVRLICLSVKVPQLEAKSSIYISGTLDAALLEELGVDATLLDLSSYVSYQCRSFILSDVTSRYEERDGSLTSYARYIKLLSTLPVNIAVFLPCHELLRRVKDLLKDLDKPAFYEEEGMPSLEHEALLREFKSFGARGGALYLGVCGGRASEGVDFPGEELDLVFIAGVPFEEPTRVVEAKLSYYVEKHGRRGHLLAYVMPALRKVCQAAGRAFRGPGDRGVVVLGDRRFKGLARLLPAWLRQAEVVSWRDRGSFLRMVAEHLGLRLEG